MNSSETQKSWLAQGLYLFQFIALCWVGIRLEAVDPLLTWILTFVFLVLGIPCLIGGAIMYGKYKDVYDYEPAKLFDRQLNGKEIRGLFIKYVYFGFVSSLSGGTLFVLLQTGIIEQLSK